MAVTSFKMAEILERSFTNQKRDTKLQLLFSKYTAQILKRGNKSISLNYSWFPLRLLKQISNVKGLFCHFSLSLSNSIFVVVFLDESTFYAHIIVLDKKNPLAKTEEKM